MTTMSQNTYVELRDFMIESNHIEGIENTTYAEIAALEEFINKEAIEVEDLEALVGVFAPGHRLRDEAGMDVTVGGRLCPRGGPWIRQDLERILLETEVKDPWATHIAYELLHPFTDGNGRSGRALWLWQKMGRAPLGFLHHFYYETLQHQR